MMKLFICWSGETSEQIATKLHEWLPTVHQSIDPFVSPEDIGKGIRWTDALASELEDSDFGLVCLTPDNLSASWLHFEAGALSKIAQSRLAPVLYQVKPGDVKGPLGMFQHTTLGNKAEMRRLLRSINEAMGSTEGNKVWERKLNRRWNELASAIENIVAIENIATQEKIRITSPINGAMLETLERTKQGHHDFVIRGTLKQLPKNHDIWLLNAAVENDQARQWPQRAATYDSTSGQWVGRISLPSWREDTFINAVVAPPTAQELFHYYGKYGCDDKPLESIPVGCENRAQVRASNPHHHRPKPAS